MSMSRKVTAALVACCCLMQAQGSMAEPERPGKPAKVEKKPVQDPRMPLTTGTPRPGNSLERIKAGKPRASNAATKLFALPGTDLGLGCAKDE